MTELALADALDAATRAHSERACAYALQLLAQIEPRLARDEALEGAFLLHDVGKLGVPRALLEKRSALSPAERLVVERHPVLGERLLRELGALDGDALCVVRSHHERWDGCGYPDRLAGDEIPLAARIFAVADALDAMTSERAYRCRRSWRDAIEEIARCAWRQFDPAVVRALLSCERRLRSAGSVAA